MDYTIFNVMGQKVKVGTTSGTIPVADLGKGIYLLQINGNNSSGTVKFVTSVFADGL